MEEPLPQDLALYGDGACDDRLQALEFSRLRRLWGQDSHCHALPGRSLRGFEAL